MNLTKLNARVDQKIVRMEKIGKVLKGLQDKAAKMALHMDSVSQDHVTVSGSDPAAMAEFATYARGMEGVARVVTHGSQVMVILSDKLEA